ncbi:MAG: branched-chain amino acid ABC transporter permease [Desulfobacca sp.]|nr:branched-chain amino acid ABC transporter permease [Desulfobacca sp.]
MKKTGLVSLLVVAGGFFLFCPFFLNAYVLRILTNIFMFAVITQALNIIAGYTGYPAFGNVVFFGLGAYGTGIMMVKFQFPFIGSMLVGSLLCIVFTAVFGLPLLRLRGHYFAIATLGLNEATRAVIDNLTNLTGGGMGLSLPLPYGTVQANTRFFYYLLLGTSVLSLLFSAALIKSRFGFALRTIRSNEESAEGFGINTVSYKILSWMISALLTGMAGCIYAYWMSYIEPSAVFDMTISIKSFVMLLLGGAGTLLGPILGAFFVEGISLLTWSYLLNYHLGILGILIMAVVLFLPRGFIAFLKDRLLFAGDLFTPKTGSRQASADRSDRHA